MEAEIWNLLIHLLGQTADESVATEIDSLRISSITNGLRLNASIHQFNFLIQALDEKIRLQLMSNVLYDLSILINRTWR